MDYFASLSLSPYVLLTQAIGFLAFFVGIYAFTNKDDTKLRIWQAAQCFLLSLHFFLLGAQSGAAITLLAGVRNLISLHKHTTHVGVIFLVLYVVVGIIRYEVPLDILPVCSALLGTTAIFYLSGIKMRIFLMAGTSLWIIYNALVFSIGPFFMEFFILIVTAHATYQLWNTDSIKPQT